jgi:hypothetical protein
MSARGHIIGPGAFVQGGETRYVVAVIDLDADEPAARLIDIGFLGHGVSVDPSRPHEAAVFEKKGPGGCRIDLREGKLIAPITTAENHHFYGHGAYSSDGSLLYATEAVIDDDYRGALVVRDAKSLQLLGELPTYGTSPHDCMLVDGTTMVIANGGGPIHGGAMPNVTYVDVKSETLVDRVDLTDPRFNAGHLARTGAGDLAVGSAPREGLPNPHQQLGALTLVPHGKPPATLRKPDDVTGNMRGETLSVAIYEPSALVVATHPDGNMVSMWRLDGSFVKRLDAFTEPRGVTLTLDQRFFVISHKLGKSVVITLVDSDTLAALEEERIDPSFTSGSHLFTHDLSAAA